MLSANVGTDIHNAVVDVDKSVLHDQLDATSSHAHPLFQGQGAENPTV
jgi:hypothetical protein